MPLISIVVPVYNEEKYIDRCLQSLEAQTWRQLQVILVDGGSTDGSPGKCDEWARRWNSGRSTHIGIVEVIHTANEGVSASRNKGINHASGEYITFVDGDDWLEPDAIRQMYLAFEKDSEVELSGCNFVIKGDANASETQAPRLNHITTVTASYFLENNILNGDTHCWGRLFKTSIIGNLRFRQDMTIGEDMLFLMEYLMRCKGQVSNVDEPYYDYYQNPVGAMNRPFTEKTMDQVKCWIVAEELLQKWTPDFERIMDDVRANTLISIMLTAGRLAKIERQVRKDAEHKQYAKVLRQYIKQYKTSGAVKKVRKIPGGYPIKLRLYQICPSLYLSLYYSQKKWKT